MLKWLVGVPVALFAAFLALGALLQANESPAQREARDLAERQRCAAALTSSMGTSTRGYADKQAYEAHVRENCKGFNLPK
jgi:hypothetical protein